MKLAVLTNEALKGELLAQGQSPLVTIEWITNPAEFNIQPGADALIDLLFEETPERISLLSKFSLKPVIINAVIINDAKLTEIFTRINGWNTFLRRNLVEVATQQQAHKSLVVEIFSQLNKTV